MPRLLKYLLYLFVFILSFLLFVYWMLPVATVKERLIQAVEKKLGSSFQVRVEKLKTYRITGIRMEDMTILEFVGEKGQKIVEAESIKARVGLFSLLFGTPKIRFEARIGGAKVYGVVQKTEGVFMLQGNFRGLDLKGIPYLEVKSGMKLQSSMEGEIQLNYNEKEPLRTEGKMEMDITKVDLKKSDLQLEEMGSIPLPDLSLVDSQSEIKAKMERGSIELASLKFKGADFYLDLKGRIFLAPEPSRYRMNLQGSFGLSQKIWEVLEILDPLLPEGWIAELKRQKGPDDRYPLSVSGQPILPQVYSGNFKIYPFKLKPF